jgi:glucose-1-phosphate cytidylyltransferase
MKVAILAGGLGTRLSEETSVKPKPMVEIGGKPILWHIMKCYASYGFNEFVVALGYKGEIIKDYFLTYNYHSSGLIVDTETGGVSTQNVQSEKWKIHLVDTGLNTTTGGRVKRLANYIGNERFFLTYGDGVCDVNIQGLLKFHKEHGKIATVTAVHPASRFGELGFDGNFVTHFAEKPQVAEGWINGGFFVLEPAIASYMDDETFSWESKPMERLAHERQLIGYKHEGFWQCMDTLREVRYLEMLWDEERAPWKSWR